MCLEKKIPLTIIVIIITTITKTEQRVCCHIAERLNIFSGGSRNVMLRYLFVSLLRVNHRFGSKQVLIISCRKLQRVCVFKGGRCCSTGLWRSDCCNEMPPACTVSGNLTGCHLIFHPLRKQKVEFLLIYYLSANSCTWAIVLKC